VALFRSKRIYRKFLPLWMMVTLVCACSGCAIARRAAANAGLNTMRSLVVAIESQPDPELVRQGLPAFILLIDGMLVSYPQNTDLLLAATNAYNSYCQAFLTNEDEAERASKLYARAKDYGLRLLRQRQFFNAVIEGSIDDYEAALRLFTVSDVPHVHAAAAAWLGWIVANSDSMAALAQLPRALALSRRVLELDDTYGNGAAHLVVAIYNAVQPRGAGQDLDKSRRHFAKAIELAGPANLTPRVLHAEIIGKATLDQVFFTETLEAVLAVDIAKYPETRLFNELAQDRAQSLLNQSDEIF